MTTISGMNSAALVILQQTNSVGQTEENKPATGDLVAIASGVAEKIGVSRQPGQAESKISEAMFSVTNLNIHKLKLDLIDRAAKALGIDESDYDSSGAFASDMFVAVIRLNDSDAGKQIIEKIEKELGLDELGVSLMDVVRSARNPEAEDNVTKALEEREDVKDDEDEKSGELAPVSGEPDEIGLYGVPSA